MWRPRLGRVALRTGVCLPRRQLATTRSAPAPQIASINVDTLLYDSATKGGAPRVTRVDVREGATVAAGDTLLVIEGDSFTLSLRAPAAGIVSRVHATVGAQPQAQSALVDMQFGAGQEPAARHEVWGGVPRRMVAWTGAALVPLAAGSACGVAAMQGLVDPQLAAPAVWLAVNYTAASLGLWGGVLWGLSMAQYRRGGAAPPARLEHARLLIGVLPVLAAAQCLTQPPEPALTLMMGTVALSLMGDVWLASRALAPPWLATIKFAVGAAVMLLLGVPLWMTKRQNAQRREEKKQARAAELSALAAQHAGKKSALSAPAHGTAATKQ